VDAARELAQLGQALLERVDPGVEERRRLGAVLGGQAGEPMVRKATDGLEEAVSCRSPHLVECYVHDKIAAEFGSPQGLGKGGTHEVEIVDYHRG